MALAPPPRQTSKLPRKLANIAWALGALLLGLAALGLQLDRQARYGGWALRLVPAPFRVYSLNHLAARAYLKGDFEGGLHYARIQARRRPVPGSSLGLLSNGLLGVGDEKAAFPPLLLSAQRGWRDNFTQLLMARLALNIDDTPTAALRILALWRMRLFEPTTFEVTAGLLDSTSGAKAFTDQLITQETWAGPFLIWATRTDLPPRSLDIVLSGFADKNLAVDCRALLPTLKANSLAGHAPAVGQVWSKLCHHALSQGAGPLDWQFPGHAGLDVTTSERAGGPTLKFRYSGNGAVTLATRIMALAPGAHTLRFDADANQDRFAVRIVCFTAKSAPRAVLDVVTSPPMQSFTVPQDSCKTQRISIFSRRGSGTIRNLSVN